MSVSPCLLVLADAARLAAVAALVPGPQAVEAQPVRTVPFHRAAHQSLSRSTSCNFAKLSVDNKLEGRKHSLTAVTAVK